MFDDLSDLTGIAASILDELTAYLEEEREQVVDVIAWWKGKQKIYPRLAQMALDFLNVPGEFSSLFSVVNC
jgi:hypothetical protein